MDKRIADVEKEFKLK